MPNLERAIPWLPRKPKFQSLVEKKDEGISLEQLQGAVEFATANIAIDKDALKIQHRINEIAMKEIDILKAERREILSAANKLVDKFDLLKIKYDGLLEKYAYLKKKKE